MNQDDISQAKNKDLIHSLAAIKRAAMDARVLAIQTNTAIVICVDGKIVILTAEQLQLEVSVTKTVGNE